MDTLSFAFERRTKATWLLYAFLMAYVVFCVYFFLQYVDPSLQGLTDQHIAADSSTYIYMADALREGRNDPWVLAALSSFPNTLWFPVSIAFALKSTWLIALLDCAIFVFSMSLFKRSAEVSVPVFLVLLLLNPTTTVSLLTVNKEIIDLLVVGLFCYWKTSRRWWVLCFALLLALINRYEVFLVMLVFILVQTRLNPLRLHRLRTLAVLILGASLALPVFASSIMASRFYEAEGAGVIAFLDNLQMHYLFFVAVIPKIMQGMFGELVNASRWSSYTFADLANSYILLFNNLSSLIAIAILLWKRSFRLASDWIYLAWIGAIFMSISLVVQPRYLYFCFVLLCFQAAQRRLDAPSRKMLEIMPGGLGANA